MSDDKMPDVIYIDRCERSMVGTLTGRFGTIKVDGDTTYYSKSHVQHLIDQAKAEQREACEDEFRADIDNECKHIKCVSWEELEAAIAEANVNQGNV